MIEKDPKWNKKYAWFSLENDGIEGSGKELKLLNILQVRHDPVIWPPQSNFNKTSCQVLEMSGCQLEDIFTVVKLFSAFGNLDPMFWVCHIIHSPALHKINISAVYRF